MLAQPFEIGSLYYEIRDSDSDAPIILTWRFAGYRESVNQKERQEEPARWLEFVEVSSSSLDPPARICHDGVRRSREHLFDLDSLMRALAIHEQGAASHKPGLKARRKAPARRPTKHHGLRSVIRSPEDLDYVASDPGVDQVRIECQLRETDVDRLAGCSHVRAVAVDAKDINQLVLTPLGRMKQLVALDLSGVHLTGVSISWLAKLEQLSVLWLDGSGVDDRIQRVLTRCSQMSSLKLRDTAITNQVADSIRSLQGLTCLDLSETSIDDSFFDRPLRQRHLSELQLNWTGITGESLSALRHLPALAFLGIQFTEIGDDDLRHLLEMPSLRKVCLRCTRTTPAGIGTARARMPDCRLVW